MSNDTPLDWSLPVADIPERGSNVKREAAAAELKAVASALEILSCEWIALDARIRPRSGGRYALEGTLAAKLTQACVVSLDPVPDNLAIDLDIEFEPGPAAATERNNDSELGDPFEETEFEPIENGRLNLGRVVFEEIASHLDPFPRAEGAELEKREAAGPGDAKSESPFAKLAGLKNKPPT